MRFLPAIRCTSPALPRAGGTLLECQRLLFDHGAEAVSAYATHGVFPREAWKLFEPADGLAGFKYV